MLEGPKIVGEARVLGSKLGEAAVKRMLQLICDAYWETVQYGAVTGDMDEDAITEELGAQVIANWSASGALPSFLPLHQKTDRTGQDRQLRGKKGPTIDFCFRSQYETNLYYGAEGKVLAVGDARRYREYIREGLRRYLTGKYASRMSTAAMLGYVRAGPVVSVLRELERRILQVPGTQSISKSRFEDSYVDCLASIHQRKNANLGPILITHLLLHYPLNAKPTCTI